MPGGSNAQLNQVLLQAPDVVQDSFGQIHVRADHNDLQYRLNGIILPEGISVFSQTLSPWLISSLKLITGALPAEYGLRTAGIIDLSTNSGLLQPGGEISVYGGSHSTYQPSAEYGGSDGQYTYYVTGDYKQDNLGIESPDGSSNPLHDHTTQIHGFGYFEDIIDSSDRLSLIMGISDDEFQIPNQVGLQPSLGLRLSTVKPTYLSNNLNETAARARGVRHRQLAALGRCAQLANLALRPLHQSAFRAGLWSGICCTTASLRMRSRMIRPSAGKRMPRTSSAMRIRCAPASIIQHDSSKSDTTSQVLPIDATRVVQNHATVPLTIIDNGTQVQQIRERLSAGRMAGTSALHHQLRSALRSLQRLFQRRPAQPARQRRVAVRHRHDAARRLFAIFHAAAVRAGRLRDLHAIRRHDRRAAGLGYARTARRSPSAPITTTSACSRSCSTRRLRSASTAFTSRRNT